MSSNSSPSPAFVYWDEYFERNPFDGGPLLANIYIKLSESKKSEICKMSGLSNDCFDLPKYDYQNRFVTSPTCDQGQKCLTEAWNLTPFKMQFLQDNNGLCGSNCIDDISTMLKKLNEDPYFKLQWESAIAKDLFLNLSTTSTRKVEKDWVITRFEWNPSLFCQHAKAITDLNSN